MSIKDVMTTNPLTVGPHDSLAVAAERMWAGDCGCLPVVDDQGLVVAMVTDRDICMATWSRHHSPQDLHVQDAMSKSVITCRADDTLETVEGAMRLGRVRRVPVVDGEGKLEGIISLADIVINNVRRTPQHGALRENNGLSTTLAVICERPALQTAPADAAVSEELKTEPERHQATDQDPTPTEQGSGRTAGTAQTAFDRAQGSGPQSQGTVGDARGGDAQLYEQVTAPEGFGPAPGGYGPASAPAGAHGGDGIFGAEGAGGGPGNDPSAAEKEEDAAE